MKIYELVQNFKWALDTCIHGVLSSLPIYVRKEVSLNFSLSCSANTLCLHMQTGGLMLIKDIVIDEERGVYMVLVGKPEGRRPLGRPRHRWVDNIRMDVQEVGCGYMDWIGLAQDRDRWRTLVSAVMNLRVP